MRSRWRAYSARHRAFCLLPTLHELARYRRVNERFALGCLYASAARQSQRPDDARFVSESVSRGECCPRRRREPSATSPALVHGSDLAEYGWSMAIDDETARLWRKTVWCYGLAD
jgi:hypothetical protein